MKTLLLFLALCFFSLTITAQTNIFKHTKNQDWNTAANWSLGVLPDANQTIIISSGSSVKVNQSISIKSMSVEKKATITLKDGDDLIVGGNLTFEEGSTFNWINGTIIGGGTLNLNGTSNLISDATKWVKGNTTINNNGTMNISDTGTGEIVFESGTLNNQVNGVINIQTPYLDISGSNGSVLNNYGVIKNNIATGFQRIRIELKNQNGTFAVQQGTLNLNSSKKYLINGIYNVSSGATLDVEAETFLEGTQTGVLDGDMRWYGDKTITNGTTVALNFTGKTGLKWQSGTLKGGGTLVNKSVLNLTSDGSKFINDSSILNNEGTMNLIGTGEFVVTDGTINNQAKGIINIQSSYCDISGNKGSVLHNYGLIKNTIATGTQQIRVELRNHDGTISVEKGTLVFGGVAKFLTDGTYNVSSGAKLHWNTEVVCEGTLTGKLDGEIFCSTSSTKIPATKTATFNFTGSAGVNWAYLDINGGGTLVNKNKITLTSAANKFIKENTTVINDGTINNEGTGNFYITSGTLSNSGTIDLKTAGGDFLGTVGNAFNNTGVIKQTNSGLVNIAAELHNNGGTIDVQQGTLRFSSLSKYLTNGMYNVATDAELNWNTEVVCEGTLTGKLDGEIFCSTSSTKIPTTKTATFNFTGTAGVNWAYLDIEGGGTLINKGKISLTASSHKFLKENTTLNNEGVMNFEGTGNFYISNGTINNQPIGVLDFKTAGGNINYNSSEGVHILNNFGLIKATSSGNVSITPATFNSGTISVLSGELQFFGTQGFTNNTTGIVKGIGTIILPSDAYFTNNGIFAPGTSPGTLTVQGNYKTSSSTVLEIELDGTNQGSNADMLDIKGNAKFNGDLIVKLGFVPTLNTEFVVVETTGTITECNLPTTVSSIYNGIKYSFSVTCKNSKQIVLTLMEVALSKDDFKLSNISLYPNPTKGQFTIDLGNQYSNVNVQVTNMLGQVISKSNFGATNKIDQEITAEAGIYFVKITTDLKESKTFRMVKK